MKVINTVGLITTAALVACATAPKPEELVSLENMRQQERYELAQEQQETLIAEAEEAYTKAMEAWEDEELNLAKHWATIGTIKVRMAQTLIDQKEARQDIKEIQGELVETRETYADLSQQIEQAEEQLRLHDALVQAKKAAAQKEARLAAELKEKEAKLKQKLTEAEKEKEQQKRLAEAQKKVADAQLALKRAETVEASTYAKGEYQVGKSLLEKAEAALKAENATDASTSADMAKTRAEAAYAAAKPKYLEAKETASRQAKNQALQKDAAAITGVEVKLQTVGQTQQLVIPVPYLFKGRRSKIRDEKVGTLNEIGELLKKYDGYPVILNGYTSHRVPRRQRYAVSQARAQRVANHFVSMGIPYKRFGITGKAAEDLIARRYSRLNDRVEIVLLFQ
jgi:outer membrane protein OmpA-like peptidoglycan-associated protein